MRLLSCLTLVAMSISVAHAGSLDGRWDATINIKGTSIPFRLDLTGEGKDLQASLFNGALKVPATSAAEDDNVITLKFDHYLTTIRATAKGDGLQGEIEGRFDREKYLSTAPFRAQKHVDEPSNDAAKAPSIAGNWELPFKSPKGEKSWRLIIQQDGPEVSASILRIDGDTGALTGTYRDGKFVLGHFSGSRPLRVEITPSEDGTLDVQLNGAYAATSKLVAYRPAAARVKGLPEPSDPQAHTTIKDPEQPFTFRFPDVNGTIVSNEDQRFRGKVVIAVVTGSWCPNCHDEAQLLVELDKKYRAQGLEIVALDFEEPEQQEGLDRVKAFIKNYGVEYTYLIAGAPIEMWAKVPQALNLNSWPTTFFIGRDGKVKSTHAGFAAPASGEFHTALRAEFADTIERLLAAQMTATKDPSE